MHLKFVLIAQLIIVMVFVHPSFGFLKDFSEKVKGFFSEKFENVGQLLEEKKKVTWNSLKNSDYASMGGDMIRELMDKGEGILPKRALFIMQDVLYKNKSSSKMMAAIQNPPVAMSRFQRQNLLYNVDPTNWTPQNLTKVINGVRKMTNNYVLRMKNDSTLREMKTSVDRMVRNTRDKKEKMRLEDLQSQLFRKIHGKAERWTNETFNLINLKEIPEDVFRKIKPEVAASRFNELIQTGSGDNSKRRMYLDKLLKISNMESKEDPLEAIQEINTWSTLKNDIMPEDLNDELLKDERIAEILDTNMKASANMGKLSPKGAKMAMVSFGKMDNITADTVTKKGYSMLGLSLPSDMKLAAKNKAFSSYDVASVVKGMRNFVGPGAEAKLVTLASVVEEAVSSHSEPKLSNYPNEVLSEIGTGIYAKVSKSEAIALLKKDVEVGEARMGMLMDKLKDGDFRNLPTRMKERIPIAKLNTFSSDLLTATSKDLPPGTVLTMKTSDKNFPKKEIMPNDVTQLLTILPYMGAKEAHQFNTTNIMESLWNMKDANPTFPACNVLKGKVYEFFRNISSSFNAGSAIEELTYVDIENLPLCVIAAFGPKQLKMLNKEQKRVLLQRFGESENWEFSILRPARLTIVKEGLTAMRVGGTGILPGELSAIGFRAADIPWEELSEAAAEVIFDIVTKFNEMIKIKKFRPCLDTKQKSAIARMVKKVKGDLSDWKSAQDMCCLLYTLPESDLARLEPEVLSACYCRIDEPSPSQMEKQILCNIALNQVNDDNREDSLEKVQQNAGLKLLTDISTEIKDEMEEEKEESETMRRRRRRRQTDTPTTRQAENDICNRAAFGGAGAFSKEELTNLNETTLYSCLWNFGFKDMDQNKAEILKSKIAEFKKFNYDELTAEEVENLGFIVKGFSGSNLRQFPAFTYGKFDDAVAMIGSKTGFTDSQLKVLAEKVIQWKDPADFGVKDILLANKLICGFDSVDINTIKLDVFKGAIGTLSKLKECPRDPILTSLAERAIKAYGEPETWDRASINEIGVIFSGLLPEHLNKIMPEAMEGLTASAVENLEPDSINSLNETHVMAMTPSALFSFSESQIESFSPSMKNAFKSIEKANEEGSAATTFSKGSSVLLLLTLPLVCVLWQDA